MDNPLRFEEMIERIKSDPITAVLALTLNEIVKKYEAQDKINEVVHSIIKNHSDQISRLSEAIESLSQGMMACISSIQKLQTSNQNSFTPFRGIEIK